MVEALDPEEMSKVVSNRLKRAHGQLAVRYPHARRGRELQDVVMQLSAVSRALDRAGFAIIASGMEQCLTHPESPQDAPALDVAKLEKLFLSLA